MTGKNMIGKKVNITKGRDCGETGTVVGYNEPMLIIDLDAGGTARQTADEVSEVKEYNPKSCIFERRVCKYAKQDGRAFECTAPTDDAMICRK